VDSSLLGDLELDESLSTFTPARLDEHSTYVGLGCPCGGEGFHLSGWPRVATGQGGFFWRTVSRVWREARVPMQDGEPVESPFWLPVFARCDRCSRERKLLGGDDIVGQIAISFAEEPRESYRCRVCRRGSVDLVVGRAADPEQDSRADFEVFARCRSCTRQARVAWSEGGRRTEQEVRLDHLYGRR
jgi:hypothetical protein